MKDNILVQLAVFFGLGLQRERIKIAGIRTFPMIDGLSYFCVDGLNQVRGNGADFLYILL